MQRAVTSKQQRLAVPCLLLLLTLCSLLSISTGPLSIDPLQALGSLLDTLTPANLSTLAPHERLIIENVRLPRTLLAMATGALLAMCGAVMQGLFRNPLADPGIIGVSSGAALGAAVCLVLLPAAPTFAVPVSAFVFGLGTTVLIYRLASHNGSTSVPLLLLAGVAIAALAGAGIGLLNYIASDTALRDLSLWQMGAIAGATWPYTLLSLAAALGLFVLFRRDARSLDALLLGESEARHLGIDTQGLKRRLVILCALGVGIAVAATGIIGFIGLVVPHLVRMVSGAAHHKLLVQSALAGALLLALADILARSLIAPAEMPVGLVTALLGAPFFVFLLIKQRHKLG
ncbi:iron ABC transporter permease [Shewanella sp. JM162201]|uniref:Iron ABC transporter permease n=1 Tax=Shewanella jiangmenensis TaxID=2837387 RepID=A0ABS5V3T0_9GAMM|nr:iron ABC transporter permease [Shewanella jiangmenensis]MBT1443713.1 iron ABC transporter permease [Shewanella jiangmenensis]